MSLQEILEDWKQKPLRDLLVELYIDQNMNMREVAKELHLSLGQVFNFLKQEGITKDPDLFKTKIKYYNKPVHVRRRHEQWMRKQEELNLKEKSEMQKQ